jgi:hypothetical protein
MCDCGHKKYLHTEDPVVKHFFLPPRGESGATGWKVHGEPSGLRPDSTPSRAAPAGLPTTSKAADSFSKAVKVPSIPKRFSSNTPGHPAQKQRSSCVIISDEEAEERDCIEPLRARKRARTQQDKSSHRSEGAERKETWVHFYGPVIADETLEDTSSLYSTRVLGDLTRDAVWTSLGTASAADEAVCEVFMGASPAQIGILRMLPSGALRYSGNTLADDQQVMPQNEVFIGRLY